MSTFRGIVAEFPRIRIDYFRQQPDHVAPLACFLSHVHSDHLTGLDSLRAPFVYCSAATREILLRLEKYHYRVNFAKGVLESRNVTYDRSMRKLAKPLPLDTPTTIELAPGNSIRVTCIDANHCVGAVMFLIEGDGKAVLYTGDIRAEVWWVNSLVQNPVLVPYTLGRRRLDCLYLDTTFATKSEPYREFPSKAEGIRELLAKVSEYSDDTIFYFHAWTFGYENVWIALSSFLKSRIHLDDYRARIYGSLSTLNRKQLREVALHVPSDNRSLRESGQEIREAPALCGFRNGNHIQPGCLTSREDVRIHSCERGMGCQIMDRNDKCVHIIPIVTRTNGADIAELGAGGGHGDLDQKEELETSDLANIRQLMELCAASIKDEELRTKVLALLELNVQDGNGKLEVDLQPWNRSQDGQDGLSLCGLVSVLSSRVSSEGVVKSPPNRSIRFPYSRHSSYSELRELVAAFRPLDVYPCTVDEERWTPAISMHNLFGDLGCGEVFRHDTEMTSLYNLRHQSRKMDECGNSISRSVSEASDDEVFEPDVPPNSLRVNEAISGHPDEDISSEEDQVVQSTKLNVINHRLAGSGNLGTNALSDPPNAPLAVLESPDFASMILAARVANETRSNPILAETKEVPNPPSPSTSSADIATSGLHRRSKKPKLNHKQLAYNAAIGTGLTWNDYGGLVSTRSKADREEQEI
ncbi:hypothetical protein T440DRAFT_501473 [Plenodomus tracheiphilus IPT5]|uniref:Protein artemis n=1 Tax=Plenodomus tracheiphilus IPT5 TaxID=1408161 RepID=A0A6A7AX33_9PLEO|nr:hypothetical protein T440DRAFT_501473 [Plenodomus tracheiphilus IPT5]